MSVLYACEDESVCDRAERCAGTAGLPGVPDGDDLLGINQRLSLGLGALGFGRSPRGCALPFLRSAVWAKLPAIGSVTAGIVEAVRDEPLHAKLAHFARRHRRAGSVMSTLA